MTHRNVFVPAFIAAILSAFWLAGCPDPGPSSECASDSDCDDGSFCLSGTCRAGETGNGLPPIGGTEDAGPIVVDAGGGVEPDPIAPGCDVDNDGYVAVSCGGNDCDDTRRDVHPDGTEACSFVDENCDGNNNEGMTCTFLATGPSVIYAIDPFAQEINVIGEAMVPDSASLLDVDRNPDGFLIGATRNGLYEVALNGTVSLLSSITAPQGSNGLAIADDGTIYLTNDDEVDGSNAYVVDSATGDVSVIGALAPYRSSGDCVVLKNGSLLMTARDLADPFNGDDVLVFVDRFTGATMPIGVTGVQGIYGLSASWDLLFGVTKNGQVLHIDTATGAAEVLFSDETLRFYGAANAD